MSQHVCDFCHGFLGKMGLSTVTKVLMVRKATRSGEQSAMLLRCGRSQPLRICFIALIPTKRPPVSIEPAGFTQFITGHVAKLLLAQFFLCGTVVSCLAADSLEKGRGQERIYADKDKNFSVISVNQRPINFLFVQVSGYQVSCY